MSKMTQQMDEGQATFRTLDRNGNRSGQQRWANDESLRLVQQLFLVQAPAPPRVVVFAGIDHGNGCTQICASVAETLARHARRPVCLVEANFRTPSLAELFGTTNHFGFTDALLGPGPIRSLAEPVNPKDLYLLSSGTVSADSASLLMLGRLQDRFAELREEFDFVIVDAAPLTRYSDAIAVAQHADGLVLVVEADATRREAAMVAAANLQAANVPILAAVLNKRRFPIPERIYSRL